MVGPGYKFICIDMGGYGKNSDGGIFREYALRTNFTAHQLNLPGSKPLRGKRQEALHCLVGDKAFSLKQNLMKPFPQGKASQDRTKRRCTTTSTNFVW